MEISSISPNSVLPDPAQIKPQTKTDPAPVQVNQDVQKAADAAKTDSVTISSQALQKNQQLTNDGDGAAKEASESAAEKATETLKGKK